MKLEVEKKVFSQNYSVIKKFVLKFYVHKLKKLKFVLEEEAHIELENEVEVWGNQFLEYNIDKINEFIISNSIPMKKRRISQLYPLTVVDDITVNFALFNEKLRQSKENNPIIMLEHKMFCKPLVINGNHRLRKAYENKIEYIDLYVLSADDVSDCLLTEDYKVAYEIYKKINKLTGMIYQ